MNTLVNNNWLTPQGLTILLAQMRQEWFKIEKVFMKLHDSLRDL